MSQPKAERQRIVHRLKGPVCDVEGDFEALWNEADGVRWVLDRRCVCKVLAQRCNGYGHDEHSK